MLPFIGYEGERLRPHPVTRLLRFARLAAKVMTHRPIVTTRWALLGAAWRLSVYSRSELAWLGGADRESP